jgi:ribosomal protein S17E
MKSAPNQPSQLHLWTRYRDLCVDRVTVSATEKAPVLEARLRWIIAPPKTRTLPPFIVTTSATLLVAGIAVSTPNAIARPQAAPLITESTQEQTLEEGIETEQKLAMQMRDLRIRMLEQAHKRRAWWEKTLTKATQEREVLRNKPDKTDADRNRLADLEATVAEAKPLVARFKQEEAYSEKALKAYNRNSELIRAETILDVAKLRVAKLQNRIAGYRTYLQYLEQEKRIDGEGTTYLLKLNKQLKQAEQAVVDKRKAYRAVQAKMKQTQSKKG